MHERICRTVIKSCLRYASCILLFHATTYLITSIAESNSQDLIFPAEGLYRSFDAHVPYLNRSTELVAVLQNKFVANSFAAATFRKLP